MSSHAQMVDAGTSLTYALCLRPNGYVQDEVGDESQINVALGWATPIMSPSIDLLCNIELKMYVVQFS
jgi:hypothetical protein